MGNLGKLRYFIVLIICFCAVISIVVIILFARNITMPLEQLSVLMDKVTQDECFQGQFQYPDKDEVGKLAKSFNFMIIKINQLIVELNENIEELKVEKDHVQAVQKQKRKAELKALQAQINPHFLLTH